jgi:hypothetical protein
VIELSIYTGEYFDRFVKPESESIQMKKTVTILIYFIVFTLQAQNPYADSLKTILSNAPTDQDSFPIVHMLNEYFNEIYVKNDSILKYGEMAIQLADKSNDPWKKGISTLYYGAGHFQKDSTFFFESLHQSAKVLNQQKDFANASIAYYLTGTWLYYKGEFEKSKADHERALKLLSKLEDNQNKRVAALLSWNYASLASCQNKVGNMLQCAENAHKSYQFAKVAGDKKRQYGALINLTTAYGELSDPDKKLVRLEDREKYKPLALKYMTEALELAKTENYVRNLGSAHINLAVYYSIYHQYEKSDSFLTESIYWGTKETNALLLYNAFTLKGQNFGDLMQFDSARYYLNLARTYAERIKSPYRLIKTDVSLAITESQRGNSKKAQKMFDALIPKIQGEEHIRIRSNAYKSLVKVYEDQGKWKLALESLKKAQSVNDSLTNEESKSEISQLQSRYETELKELEIEQLKQEKDIQLLKIKHKNQLIYLILLGAGLLASLIFYYFQRKSSKAKENALATQQKLLRSQLNPHFLFNSLNSIQQFVYQKKDPQMIADYLGKFSRLTRRILQYSREDYVTLEDEIKFLKDYLDLQKIRFDEPFEYEIILDEDMEEDELLIPPLFTQPFVENSIEHGIMHKQEKGKIQVRFSKNTTHLIATMTDNGVGREMAAFKKRNQEHRSMATKITMERLKVMEKKLHKKASLAIQDLSEKEMVTGTEVTVTLPIMYA